MSIQRIIRTFLPNTWFKVLTLVGGAALLAILSSGALDLRSLVKAIISLGLFLIGIGGWIDSKPTSAEKMPKTAGRIPAGVHPAIRSAALLVIPGILSLSGGILGVVLLPDVELTVPPENLSATDTPEPGICRIAFFTNYGSLYAGLEDRELELLNNSGDKITPIYESELQAVSSSFGQDYDVAVIPYATASWNISELIRSGVGIVTMNPIYVNALGLGIMEMWGKIQPPTFKIVDTTHPITAGLPHDYLDSLSEQVYLSAINSSSFNDAIPLIIEKPSGDAILAVHKTMPHAWLGVDFLDRFTIVDNRILADLLERTVAWACAAGRTMRSMGITPVVLPTWTWPPPATPTVSKGAGPAQTDTPGGNPSATPSPTNTWDIGSTPTPLSAITATPVRNHIPGNLFTDANCGISFEYPLEWIVDPTKNWYGDFFPCFFGLKPKTYGQIATSVPYYVDNYAITVGVVDMRLAYAANLAGFDYKNGKWIIYGRQMMELPAELMTARGLYILRGMKWFKMFYKECDCLAGWGEADYAVISDGGMRSIIIHDDTTQFQLHFEYILQTIDLLY